MKKSLDLMKSVHESILNNPSKYVALKGNAMTLSEYNALKHKDPRTVYYITDVCCYYVGNTKILLNEEQEDCSTLKSKYTNCPNCGAPMHSNICEYCGSEF